MNEKKVTINEMIARMVAEARRLGYSESSIWTNIQPGLRAFAIYYGKKGISLYNPEITSEYVGFQKERLSRNEISDYYYRNIRSAANRLNEFYLTGTIHLNMPKHGSKYLLRAENERLIFLKETGVPAPDCAGLFSYKVYRDMPIQSYVTDEELDRILAVIDTESGMGKRDRAIILTAATTGLRACDLIRLKLSDIDWRKGEIRLCQKKTGRTVYVPLVKQTGAALQDYILNARPASDCPEVFLRVVAPKTAIANAVCIGSMFQQYQKKAGIARHAFDGKGFHGLRRRLAKKLLVTGTPLTTIAQILGHDDLKSLRQYLSPTASIIPRLRSCRRPGQPDQPESIARLFRGHLSWQSPPV